MAKSKLLKVELVSPKNRDIQFKPTGKPLRGRKDFSMGRSDAERAAREEYNGGIIPGIRCCVNFDTEETYTEEPLHDQDNEELRRHITNQRGERLGPRRVDYTGETVTTWAYHLKKLMDRGLARVLEGEIPPMEDLPGTPRKRFYTREDSDRTGRAIEALETQTQATKELVIAVRALTDRVAPKQPTSTK